ncbi:MAG TPA: bifunctional hydroxymethylpyrimidine kinase/phosphomethylpyrimidine kinase [Lactobacillus sp.]|nr:bifunctional hydroxymethylpyrimidine kinase/phosphomethylpyrimidine kinase [Lactobacillus sp.]
MTEKTISELTNQALNQTQFPQALSIAGSDSGGGAGMQADLKTIQERHVFATTVLVAVTAQNTLGVQDAFPLPTKIIDEQFASLDADLAIKACKTGMLADTEHVLDVVKNLKRYDFGPLTVDPVMIAKGGAPLLTHEAIATVRDALLPLATILTPNLPEAEALTGQTIDNDQDMQEAGKRLQALGAKNVIVKGGHEDDPKTASDYVLLEDGHSFWLRGPRVDTHNTHGTGDTLSACITAELAKGASIEEAIRIGKAYVSATIAQGIKVGHGHGPLNHWAVISEGVR